MQHERSEETVHYSWAAHQWIVSETCTCGHKLVPSVSKVSETSARNSNYKKRQRHARVYEQTMARANEYLASVRAVSLASDPDL